MYLGALGRAGLGDALRTNTGRAGLCVLFLGLASLPATGSALAASGRVSVTSTPAFTPGFQRQIRDYVVRCEPARRLTLSFDASRGAKVSVDRRRRRAGKFEFSTPLTRSQGIRFTVYGGHRHRTYSVRCLPPDFPTWTTERNGRPQAAYYVLAPSLSLVGGATAPYAAIFDSYGVPVWWKDTGGPALDASLLRDGNVAWAQRQGQDISPGISSGRYEAHRLDGRLVRTFYLPDGTPTDRHELQIMPNGDYVAVGYKPRDHVNLLALGGPKDATVLDAVVEEVTPRHRLVWAWNSKDHIGLAETGRWFGLAQPVHLRDGRTAYDIVHINAVERYGTQHFLISLRHTDAIYDIAKSTGDVVWKMGGTKTPKSLRVVGDNVAYDFGGQHDVRRLRDGTITLHDNGTYLGRPPRALRFRVSAKAGTATLVEKVSDKRVVESMCCGGARKLRGGDWVMSWGGNSLVTELTPAGKPVLSLSFGRNLFSYRANPVMPGRLKLRAIRHGMDRMNPR